MGVTDDGEITALRTAVVADTGAYPNGVGHIVLSNGRDRPLDLYRIPNYEYESISVFTNNVPAGEYRGIGVTQSTFALESHVDEAARRVGIDPLAFRRRNFLAEGEHRSNGRAPIDSFGALECLERGQSTFQALTSDDRSADDETLIGWGVAAGTHTTGSGAGDGTDVSEARLTAIPDGSIVASTAAVELGQGSDTVLTQIVCQELGVHPESVRIERYPASDGLEDSLGSVASRSTYIVGAAVKRAAESLREEVTTLAASRLECEPEAVRLDAGVAIAGEETVPVEHLLEEEIQVVGRATADDAPASYGVHFAEVAVDPRTGCVDVRAFVAAQDVGFAINPRMVEGQLTGAVLHGIEFALYADLLDEEGTLVNATLADYPIGSTAEMPGELECVIVESAEESGPYGVKGLGTPSQPPVAPAIANAVRDATGRHFPTAPITPERIHRELTK